MYYLYFIDEVVDTKFCMKQLCFCDVPDVLLFLDSFVILKPSSLPGEQGIMYSACAKLTCSVIQDLDAVVTPVT